MAGEGTSRNIPASAAAKSEAVVVVVGQQFAAAKAVDLTVTRYDVLTFMDVHLYTVVDVDGDEVFKVNRVQFGSSRRVLLDAAGDTLLTMKPDGSNGIRGLDFCEPWNVYRGDSTSPSDLLFSVGKSKLLQFDQFKVILATNANQAATCDFKIDGSGRSVKCTISIGQSDTIIAQMSSKRAFLQPEKLLVTVSPNIDCAFIVSLIVIIEEFRRKSGVSDHSLLW
ncbi:protein LURP-one-related 10-like [Curcuma longa]|uniref:protein LURP-one-related 10-like n=1 Tax=Curcuma longa TaxID=136217 RepID=UPI003D9EE8C5